MTKIVRSATFSKCREYRYLLRRTWCDSEPVVMFIGLNPSTADENCDDPTVRRCVGFAQSWGYGGLILANLFGFRATDPSDLSEVADPIGPDNDKFIMDVRPEAERVVVAWGVRGSLMGRDRELLPDLGKVYCLGTSHDGSPKHPLYLPKATTPRLFTSPNGGH